MKFLVTVDEEKYEIVANDEREASALAVRYFARDHPNAGAKPEKGRVKSCEVVE